jgi:hypothetical protein
MIKPITAFAWRVYAPLDRTEKLFMKMTNIFTMVNQVGMKCSVSYKKDFSNVMSDTQYVLCRKELGAFSLGSHSRTDIKSFLTPSKINIRHKNLISSMMHITEVEAWESAVQLKFIILSGTSKPSFLVTFI